MRKIFVNSNTDTVRTLSPFAYKDTIKTLDKSNEARVTLDGVQCHKSAVTSGRDVKSSTGGMKYHLYFYMTAEAAKDRDTARREFLPMSAEEFRAYKQDPGYVVVIASATGLEQPLTGNVAGPEAEAAMVVSDEVATAPVAQRRKAKR